MTAREFVELVQQMRDKQKLYFKTRSSDVLLESKALERQVDLAAREYPWQRNDLLGGLEQPT